MRIVVKVGTSTLAHATGALNIRRTAALCRVLADIKNAGHELVLVSSGAIGMGVGKLSLSARPTDMSSKQACAAVGQCELMYIYDKLFSEYNHVVSQMLLTSDIIRDKKRKENVVNTFERLLEYGAIPIVNENDSISTEEIEFGDNDTLSATVSILSHADVLVILTDIDGLYDKDPHHYADAELIPRVSVIDGSVRALAGDSAGKQGTGGMITKLNAAEMVMKEDIAMYIINGASPDNLYRLFDGEQVGTLFERAEDK